MVLFKQVVFDLMVLVALMLVMFLMIYVTLENRLLTVSEPIPEYFSTYITVGVTICATLFTKIVTGRLKICMLRSLEHDLRGISARPSGRLHPREQIMLRDLDLKWRGTLGITDLREKLYTSQWVWFAICSLITTGIVVVFRTTITTVNVEYHAVMAGGLVPKYGSAANPPCAGIAPVGFNVDDAYTWKYENGSSFYSLNRADCPISLVFDLITSVNQVNASDYTYLTSGVAVKSSAIGAPIWTYSGAAFNSLSRNYGGYLLQTQQCAPVMVSNPVQCHRGGNLVVQSSHSVTLTSGIDGTGIWGQEQQNISFPFRDTTTDSIMANHPWLQANATLRNGTDTIGIALTAFGAYDPPGSTLYTQSLAGAMNDPYPGIPSNSSITGSTYVVTCSLDSRSVLDYRMVTLDLQATDDKTGTDFAYYLSGGESCKPNSTIVNDVHLATAARSSQALVFENQGVDGYFATLALATGFNRTGPYAFNNSRNALEDVLGLAAAMAVANLPLTQMEMSVGNSHATIQATRWGSAKPEILIAGTPLLITFIILAYYFVRSIGEDWRPGGPKYARFTTRGKEPQRYAAESLYELVTLRGSPIEFAELQGMARMDRPPPMYRDDMTRSPESFNSSWMSPRYYEREFI